MRKIITLIIVLLFMNTSYGQKWITPGAEWGYLSYFYGLLRLETTKAKLGSDTIIDNQLCQRIISDYSSYYTYRANDTVYFYINGVFQPSMYFNANIGDTLAYSYEKIAFAFGSCDTTNSSLLYIVDTIYYRQIDTLSLKTYNLIRINLSHGFYHPYRFSYSERIGFLNNVYPQFECVTDPYEYYLCFYRDSFISLPGNCPTSVVVINAAKFSIYPNPSSHSITIEAENYPNSAILFFDVIGREIFSTEIQDSETQIDVSNWQRGVYFYSILKDGISQQNGKIVLE